MNRSAWVADRLPTADDGDLQGMVRWGPLQPGRIWNSLPQTWPPAGTWKQASAMYVRESGTWKTVSTVSTRVSGAWKT